MSAAVALHFHEIATLADTIAAELAIRLPAIPRHLVQRASRSVAADLIKDGQVALLVNGRAVEHRKGNP